MMTTLTCGTEGCGNFGIPIELDLPPELGAMCGVCGVDIADMVRAG